MASASMIDLPSPPPLIGNSKKFSSIKKKPLSTTKETAFWVNRLLQVFFNSWKKSEVF